MRLTVHNRGHNPVEAAGRVFPARRTTSVDVDDPSRAVEIDACARLAVVEVETPDDLESLKVDELRELARHRDLPTSGTKGDLLKRLQGGGEDDEDT